MTITGVTIANTRMPSANANLVDIRIPNPVPADVSVLERIFRDVLIFSIKYSQNQSSNWDYRANYLACAVVLRAGFA
jgi:hypothetical protein